MKSKFTKYILSGISAIVLGALGSALWEIALHPFFKFIFFWIMNLYSNFFDNVYRYVATGGNYLSNIVAIYFLLFLILFFYFGPTRLMSLFDHVLKPFPIGIAYFILFGYILTSRTYYDVTDRCTLRDFEIVAPYISDQEYKELRSSFYSMDSKADYTSLRSTIDQIMESEGL